MLQVLLSPRAPSSSLVKTNRLIQTNGDLGVWGKKRRSLWFFLANSHFKRIRDLGFLETDRLAALETYFDNWRAAYSQKYVHLEKGKKHVFIKQYSRFDDDYRQFLRRRFRLLNCVRWDLKIELTIDPKKCMRYSDGFFLLQKGFNRLNSWLRRRYGDFDYLKVLEIQKSGRPHFHVLISGVKWIDHGELSDLWASYGCGEVVYLKRVDSVNQIRMSAYVLKYVNKTLKSENKAFSAVLFASNKRLFSLSKGAQTMANVGRVQKEKAGFVFSGSVFQCDLADFCDENGLELKAHLVVEAEYSDYYEFPNVFGLGEGG
mgnify:CR=1 FL=1